MQRPDADDTVLVIGAGIGGLATALRLAGAGHAVRVIEAADTPGGKLRTVPSLVGPVDTGPTVMTMRPVFEKLFADAGLSMGDFVTSMAEPLLARHWWPDGAQLDLFADPEASASAVRDFGGATAEDDFRTFHKSTAQMFQAFEQPVMQSARPDLAGILGACSANPGMVTNLLPGKTLSGALGGMFRDPRLRQLFGRYATYVGGSPFQSPALLSLIWQAEAQGVWRVQGGMSALAHGLERAAHQLGATFEYNRGAYRIHRQGNCFAVDLRDGDRITAKTIVFNGDPAALMHGLVGPDLGGAVKPSGVTPRSLSAFVWAFAATPTGRDLAHHNVFFNTDYQTEFAAIAGQQMPTDPALYVCAQDRGAGLTPCGLERFEIIMNAAPVNDGQARAPEEYRTCRTQTFQTLSDRGLDFAPLPDRPALTTPHDFAIRFPGSAGSLYGRSPHGMLASFQRPTVRSRIPGLYLAGGGIHPGAGLPMAATSGRLAAEAIMKDRALTSRFRKTAMPGGMSTGFPTAAPTASRSSVS